MGHIMTKPEKRKGRLSMDERRYIAEQYDKQTPTEIAENLNRCAEPVFNYLDKIIPHWRNYSPLFSDSEKATVIDGELVFQSKASSYEETKEFHQKVLALSSSANMSYVDAKKSIRKEESVAVQTIDDLESLKESLYNQSKFITKLTQEIVDNTDYWKRAASEWAAAELTADRRDLEVQRSQLHGEIMKKHSMPLPPEPTMTAGEFLQTEREPVAGIYFFWEGGKVAYVGKANNIFKRIKSHKSKSNNKVSMDMPLSWLDFPKSSLYNTECFYIWCLSPKFNGETIRDSHHVPDGHKVFSNAIKDKVLG